MCTGSTTNFLFARSIEQYLPSLGEGSLRFAPVVMRVDEDRRGRVDLISFSPRTYHSPFRSPSLARRLIVLSVVGSLLSEI